MDRPLVGIMYQLANGKWIRLNVSVEVMELLEQSDREIRSQKRKDRRHLNFVESVDELDTLLTQPHEDTAALVSMMGDCKRLYTAINNLPESQRRRLFLYFFEELTYRQIADFEGVSAMAVIRSVKRALDTLRKIL